MAEISQNGVVLAVDTSGIFSSTSTSPDLCLKLPEVLDVLISLFKLFIASNPDMKISILVGYPLGAHFVYPDALNEKAASLQTLKYPRIERKIRRKLKSISNQMLSLSANDRDKNLKANYALDKVLCKAVCFLNKIRSKNGRIIVFQTTGYNENAFIAVLNAAFGAQKLGIIIDTVDISPSPTDDKTEADILLRKISRITGGLFLSPANIFKNAYTKEEIVQLCLMFLLPSIEIRKSLNIPTDLTLSRLKSNKIMCFCHKLVDQGFVCSVCLAVHCSRMKECPMCGIETAETETSVS